MRHLKTYQIFESAKSAGLTKKQEKFLNNFTRGTWSYDSVTGLVDVKGDFSCNNEDLVNFKGVKFGKVGGVFDCDDNPLTSLAGAPQKVGGDFYCRYNQLTTLEGAPLYVAGDFSCSNNRITSLEGAPQEVGGHFYCYDNSLTCLAGAPQKVGGYFDCDDNRLKSLVGAPQEVGRDFSCFKNPLTSLAGAPQKVRGSFYCKAFTLKEGQWNPRGWLKVLQEGNSKAQSLILTLLSPEALNKEIQKDPAGMVMKLKDIWNDKNFRETRSKLVWPGGYEKEADLVGDLDNIGF